MKQKRHAILIALLLFGFVFNLHAGSEGLFKKKSEDDQTVTNALKSLFTPNNYSVSGLSSADNGSGGKTLSGTVSFFGSDGVTFSADVANKKVKTIQATFPASTSFPMIKSLNRLLPVASLREKLPQSFLNDPQLHIKSFTLALGPDGKSLKSFEADVVSNEWDFMSFGGFKLKQLGLNLKISKAGESTTIDGLVTGKIAIGTGTIDVSTNIPRSKDQWEITGSLSGQNNLTLAALLTAVGGDKLKKEFELLAPGPFLNFVKVPNFSMVARPGKKDVEFTSTGSSGTFELKLHGMGAGNTKFSLSYGPPQNFKWGDIASELAWIDGAKVKLQDVKIKISNMPGTQGSKRVRNAPVGIFVEATITEDQGSRDMLMGSGSGQMPKIVLMGGIDVSMNVLLAMDMQLNIELGGGWKFEGVTMYMENKMGARGPNIGLNGSIVIPIDGTRLRFLLGLSSQPAAATMAGEFELQSINDNGDLKEWREPFGIPYITFVKIGGGLGISGSTLIDHVMLTGNLKLGKIPTGATDHRVNGNVSARLDVDIAESWVKGSIKNVNIIALIRAFDDKINLGGEIERFLDIGVDSAMVDINIQNKYVKLYCDATFFGVKGNINIQGGKSGIAASGYIDPIELKLGDWVIFGIHGTGGAGTQAMFDINLTASDPGITIDAEATVLGIVSASTKIQIDKTGFEFDVSGELLGGAVKASVHVHGRDFANKADIMVSVRLEQTLLKQVRETVVAAIRGDADENEMSPELRGRIKSGKIEFGDIDNIIEYCVLDGIQAIRNVAAEVVDQILGAFDIRSITFTAGLQDVKAKMSVQIEFVTNLGGKETVHILSLEIEIDMKDIDAFLSKIGEVIKDKILELFNYLGEQLAKAGKALAEAFEKVGEFCEEAADEFGSFFTGQPTKKEMAAMQAQAKQKAAEERARQIAAKKAELKAKYSRTAVIDATKRKDVNFIKNGIKEGAELDGFASEAFNIAVMNKDINMCKTWYMQGAKADAIHLEKLRAMDPYPAAFAGQICYFGAKPGAADVTKVMELKNVDWLVWDFYSRGAPATKEHLREAYKQKKYPFALHALRNGVVPEASDLEEAIAAKDEKYVSMLLQYGAVAKIAHLNNAVTNKQYNMARMFLNKVKPDQDTYVAGANTNYPSFFQELVNSKVPITSVEPAKIAIDKDNTDILVMCLQNGVKAQDAMNHATRSFKFTAAKNCVYYGSNPNQALGASIAKSDMHFYRQLVLDYGADGTTALDISFTKDKIEYGKVAVEEGNANPNKILQKASDEGKFNWVTLLLDNGGNPDLAMNGIVQKENKDLLKKALEMGGNPDKPDYLKHVAKKNNTEMTKMLVEYGANPNPGMAEVINHNNLESVKFLLAYGADPKGHLSTPSSRGKIEIVKELLEYGGNPDEGMKGATANVHAPVTKMLLEYGASPDGYMDIPATKGSMEIVQMLVEYGADPNEGIKGSVVGNHPAIVRYLLEFGAVPKNLVKFGAKNGSVEIVTLLCDYGDDPTPGMMPGVEFAHLPIVKLLHKKYKVDPTPEKYIVKGVEMSKKESHSAIVKYLLDAGADPNTYHDPKSGETLLHIACDHKKDHATVVALIEGKADMEAVDNKGWTPLHKSVDRGNKNYDTTVLLVEKGADVNACTYKFKSILKIADGIKVSRYLKEKGAEKEGCKALKQNQKNLQKNSNQQKKAPTGGGQ